MFTPLTFKAHIKLARWKGCQTQSGVEIFLQHLNMANYNFSRKTALL